jgi:hypothetical protein
VTSESELFPSCGSAVDDATFAEFVIVPAFVGFTTMVTVAVCPEAMVPRLQRMAFAFGAKVHVPCVEVDDTSFEFFGSRSSKLTPAAVAGPRFVTVTV